MKEPIITLSRKLVTAVGEHFLGHSIFAKLQVKEKYLFYHRDRKVNFVINYLTLDILRFRPWSWFKNDIFDHDHDNRT